jgi:hypothetical protein
VPSDFLHAVNERRQRKQEPLPESVLRVLYARPVALDRGKFSVAAGFLPSDSQAPHALLAMLS